MTMTNCYSRGIIQLWEEEDSWPTRSSTSPNTIEITIAAFDLLNLLAAQISPIEDLDLRDYENHDRLGMVIFGSRKSFW